MSEPRRLTVMVCRGPTCGERRNSAALHAKLEKALAEEMPSAVPTGVPGAPGRGGVTVETMAVNPLLTPS